MHKHGNFNWEWNSPKQTQICRLEIQQQQQKPWSNSMIKIGWRELTPSGQLGLLKTRQRSRESRLGNTNQKLLKTNRMDSRQRQRKHCRAKQGQCLGQFHCCRQFPAYSGGTKKTLPHSGGREDTGTLWAARGRRRATLAETTIGWWLYCWEESAEDRRQHLHDSASEGILKHQKETLSSHLNI